MSFEFCCRRCRCSLFRENAVLSHDAPTGPSKKNTFVRGGAGATGKMPTTTIGSSEGVKEGGPPVVGMQAGDSALTTSSASPLSGGMDEGIVSLGNITTLSSSEVENEGTQILCTSLFLDPDIATWVAEESRTGWLEGEATDPDTIYCPNSQCRCKLGTQSWSGTRCSCGAWVTPAFKILKKLVDKLPL